MKKFGLLLLGLLAATFVFAQDDEYGSTMDQPVRKPAEFAWEQVDVGEFSDPVAYAPIRQADVMYYYTVWRTIDLREKVNHPLYFPSETKGTWRSLAQTIFDAIDMANPDKTDGVLPVYADEMCTMPTSREDLRGNLSEISQIPEIDLETGEEIGMKELVVEYEPKQIISYNVKEIWYFDKQTSRFYVQILEIEPIIEHERASTSYDYDSEGGESDDNDVRGTMMKKRVGYIYYPELRPFLAKQEVFNVKNNAQRLSFDDLITWKRDFTSYIYKEANVYDRDIADYIANSRDQRIESERITDQLRTLESDLWEF
ncbi:MAG: gliding motility protein GldN [Bacteroidales bacterium]|jgi:gliding motility associated protien GldN|nr:gliding motility protein GldN [Bacteroidales bacterium]MBR3572474.1 gliding motility protein GldN [Bacteroidales bacterium]